MALDDIDLPRAGTHGHTPEQRLQAALAWCITGTGEGASRECGINVRTINDWTKQEWWDPLVQEARQLKQSELDASLTNIIDKCAKRLTERLDSDEGISKAGIQQIATTLAIAMDKRSLMRGDPTSRTERVSSQERLDKLKGEFAGLMQARVDKVNERTQH